VEVQSPTQSGLQQSIALREQKANAEDHFTGLVNMVIVCIWQYHGKENLSEGAVNNHV
jgi:hypothetical protein